MTDEAGKSFARDWTPVDIADDDGVPSPSGSTTHGGGHTGVA
ncbi:hypothetical protein [Micromonospora echinospora]